MARLVRCGQCCTAWQVWLATPAIGPQSDTAFPGYCVPLQARSVPKRPGAVCGLRSDWQESVLAPRTLQVGCFGEKWLPAQMQTALTAHFSIAKTAVCRRQARSQSWRKRTGSIFVPTGRTTGVSCRLPALLASPACFFEGVRHSTGSTVGKDKAP